MYFLINNCVPWFLETCMMVLICFSLVEMVTASCPMSGNSSKLYILSFVSLGFRTRCSRYVLAKMMLASFHGVIDN